MADKPLTTVGIIERIDRPEGKNTRMKINGVLYFGSSNVNSEMSTMYSEGDLVAIAYYKNPAKDGNGFFHNIVNIKPATQEDLEMSTQQPLVPEETENNTPPARTSAIASYTSTANAPKSKVPEAYTVVVQGRRIITANGLVKLAHDHGFKNYTVLKFDHDDKTAFAHVKVELKNGTFEAVASANVAYARGNMTQHVIELAETRALNRALRRGLPIDFTDIEDLFDTEDKTEETQ